MNTYFELNFYYCIEYMNILYDLLTKQLILEFLKDITKVVILPLGINFIALWIKLTSIKFAL